MKYAALLAIACILLISCTDATPATLIESTQATPDVKSSIVWVKYEYQARAPDGAILTGSGSGSGVITNAENGELRIFTNRHVIDCAFTEDPCGDRITERVSVRTQDGTMHPVQQVAIAPHNLDIAVLTVKTRGTYRPASYSDTMNLGDRVIAVGYPSYAARVLEFSEATGRITALKDLLMDDGYAFASIESDAYTYLGSSGGGLFSERGDLIGINTWVDVGTPRQRSIAIRLSALDDLDIFYYCEGGYPGTDDTCYPYCTTEQILGPDGTCSDACDDFYCQMRPIYGNDERCTDEQYILGEDGWCHLPCGSETSYCEGTDVYCYRNRCNSCPDGTLLFENGICA